MGIYNHPLNGTNVANDHKGQGDNVPASGVRVRRDQAQRAHGVGDILFISKFIS